MGQFSFCTHNESESFSVGGYLGWGEIFRELINFPFICNDSI